VNHNNTATQEMGKENIFTWANFQAAAGVCILWHRWGTPNWPGSERERRKWWPRPT